MEVAGHAGAFIKLEGGHVGKHYEKSEFEAYEKVIVRARCKNEG